MPNRLLDQNYIKSRVNVNPFLDLPLNERPQLVSGCTLAFSIDPMGKIFILVGQQNTIKANTPKTNVWDLSGGGLHENEPYSYGATREFSEELGLLAKHTIELPHNIFKIFTENHELKAKVIFVRYFDYASFTKFPKEFVQRSRSVIESLDNRFEYTRLGLVALDDFFAQLSKDEPHHREMPTAIIEYISGWINLDPKWSPNNINRWRRSVHRIYDDPQMQEFIREEINEFVHTRQQQNFISQKITHFPVMEVPTNINLQNTSIVKHKGSVAEFLQGRDKAGVKYLAKINHSKDPYVIARTVRNEEIARKFYELIGINVVPGKIKIDKHSGQPHYLMLDMHSNYPKEPFTIGTKDITEALPNLFQNQAVMAEVQAGLFISLLLGNTNDTFSNRYWRKNIDDSITLLLANCKISPLLSDVSPLHVYLLLTNVGTLTCINEPFNQLIDYKAIRKVQDTTMYSNYLQQMSLFKTAILDPVTLSMLQQEFSAKISDAAIQSIVTAAYEQLPAAGEYVRDIEARITATRMLIKSLEQQYRVAVEFIATHQSRKTDANKAELDNCQARIDHYFVNRGLLAMAEHAVEEMQVYSSEQEYLIHTLQKRREAIVQIFTQLSPTPVLKERTARNSLLA